MEAVFFMRGSSLDPGVESLRYGSAVSCARPERLALLDEGGGALAEVGAGVGAGDEVVAVGHAAMVANAAQGLLGDLERDGRVLRQLEGDRLHAGVCLLGAPELVHAT